MIGLYMSSLHLYPKWLANEKKKCKCECKFKCDGVALTFTCEVNTVYSQISGTVQWCYSNRELAAGWELSGDQIKEEIEKTGACSSKGRTQYVNMIFKHVPFVLDICHESRCLKL